MAETTADVRRDIELTRDRISNTLNQLEQKVHVTQIIKDHPWPSVGLALGAGFLLSGSSVDVRAAASTVAATKGASSRLGGVLDDLVANLMGGLSAAFEQKVELLVNELKEAMGAPINGAPAAPAASPSRPTPTSSFAQGGAHGGMTVSTSGSQGMGSGSAGANSGYGASAD